MKVKTLVGNAILAALYIAVTLMIQPLAFTQFQFRISEMFNHLVVFNKKYIYGIVAGVFLTNLLFSPLGVYDLIFGVGQSLLALLITIYSMRYIHGVWARMIVNTIVFTFTMFLIALELNLVFDLPFAHTWYTVAVGEFVVMAVGAPVVYLINKRLRLEDRI